MGAYSIGLTIPWTLGYPKQKEEKTAMDSFEDNFGGIKSNENEH